VKHNGYWLELSEYFFGIHYKKGTNNLKADALSHKPGDKPEGGGEIPQSVLKIKRSAECSIITSDNNLITEICSAQKQDKKIMDLYQPLDSNSIPAEMTKATKAFKVEAELLVGSGCILCTFLGIIFCILLETSCPVGNLSRVDLVFRVLFPTFLCPLFTAICTYFGFLQSSQ
jgi:hypothetical protein